ncbi:DUF3093 family protein [Nocardioides aurantiacus]
MRRLPGRPADPTPYWLFSTRQPAQVLHLLTSAPRRPSTAPEGR